MVNNYFNAYIMKYLQEKGIANAFYGIMSNTNPLVKKLDMIPVECVIRNIAAGSICQAFGY